jgi:hypothetical protein
MDVKRSKRPGTRLEDDGVRRCTRRIANGLSRTKALKAATPGHGIRAYGACQGIKDECVEPRRCNELHGET